jgi:hypothetical protein
MIDPSGAQQSSASALYDPKLRLCRRCGSIERPAIARRAWSMFGYAAVGFALEVLAESARAAAGQSVATSTLSILTGIAFLGGLFHGRVCKHCQSNELVPLDTPTGRSLVAAGRPS